ncbi:MAG: DUF177 domain-containing protein [Ignavibacteria bacterium]|nr:DUF177 domain-containing protein [Ignavibacteria bacterium]
MKIFISDLNEGEFFYNFVEDSGKLNLNIPELTNEISIDVRITKSTNFILLKISVSGIMKFECDRCFEMFNYKFQNDFDLLYRFEELNVNDKSDKEDDNVYYISRDENEIDIREPLRDYILLSIPMKKNPEEKDGVCMFCKRKIEDFLKTKDVPAENPVWDKLKKLKT